MIESLNDLSAIIELGVKHAQFHGGAARPPWVPKTTPGRAEMKL